MPRPFDWRTDDHELTNPPPPIDEPPPHDDDPPYLDTLGRALFGHDWPEHDTGP